MEIKKEVKTFEVEYLCDKCNEPVVFSGRALLTSPMKYPHSCQCGEEYVFYCIYPKTVMSDE